MKLKEYVEIKYPDALNAIRHSESAKDVIELTDYEKAIIYAYSDEGYAVNAELRNLQGQQMPEFARYLNKALSKLPSKKGVVYRGIWRIDSILEKYRLAVKTGEILIEYGFTSTSRVRDIAEQFGEIILNISSKNGKAIEKFTKFGSSSFDNEEEILFKCGSKFKVLRIIEKNNFIVINLEEK